MSRFLAAMLLVSLAAGACSSGGGEATDTPAPALTDVIAFGAQSADGAGLFVVRPDGTGVRPLNQEAGPVSFPVWSPDGTQIAYAVGASGAGGAATLRIFNVQRDAAVTVSESAVVGDGGPPASWSPDSGGLVFAELRGTEATLRVYDAVSGAMTDFPAIAGSEPAWSPDGQEIAFVRADGLYVVDAAGSGEPALLAQAESPAAPRWSPDGDRLLLTAGAADARELLLVDRGSGDTSSPGAGELAAWSPDGSLIAFSTPGESGTTDLDLFAEGPDGSGRRTISVSVTRDVFATWSPDSGSVAYVSRADPQTAFICVVRLQPEQHDCLQLPELNPTTPAWSPQ